MELVSAGTGNVSGNNNQGRDPKEVLDAVYSAVVEKPSSITQFYPINTLIGVYDIEQAYIRCSQFFSTYRLAKSSCSIEVKTEKGEFQRAADIAEFRTYDQSQKSCVKSVDIEMSFLAQAEGMSQPGNFKIEVNFRNVPPIFRNAPFEIPDEVRSPIRIRIEFPDYVIARSLKLVLDEWAKALPKSEPSNVYKTLQRVHTAIAPVTAAMIGFFCSLGVFLWVRDSEVSNIETLRMASFSVCFYFVLRVFSRFLVNIMMSKLTAYSVASGFNITDGDKGRIQQHENRNSRLETFAIGLFGVIVLNMGSGMMGQYLYDAFIK
jgi:hypothetical protein